MWISKHKPESGSDLRFSPNQKTHFGKLSHNNCHHVSKNPKVLSRCRAPYTKRRATIFCGKMSGGPPAVGVKK